MKYVPLVLFLCVKKTLWKEVDKDSSAVSSHNETEVPSKKRLPLRWKFHLKNLWRIFTRLLKLKTTVTTTISSLVENY